MHARHSHTTHSFTRSHRYQPTQTQTYNSEQPEANTLASLNSQLNFSTSVLISLSSLSQVSRFKKETEQWHTHTHWRRNSGKWLWCHQMQQTHSTRSHHCRCQPNLLLPPTYLLFHASISPSSSKLHPNPTSGKPNLNFPLKFEPSNSMVYI